MKSSMRKVVLARAIEDSEALAAHVLLRGRDPQVGDGSHGLSTERGFSVLLHQAWGDTLDQAVDMYGKLTGIGSSSKVRLDDMLKAQRHAVDRDRPALSSARHRAARSRRQRRRVVDPACCPSCRRSSLREDQSDLANCRKARFEETAERHAGLSQSPRRF